MSCGKLGIVEVKMLYPKRPGDFGRWLSRHSSGVQEAWLVFRRKTSGKRLVTYQDTLQDALCYGWIDSRVKTLDAEKFLVRFTPRKPGSSWSKRNLQFAKLLLKDGKMTPAGIAVLPSRLSHEAHATANPKQR